MFPFTITKFLEDVDQQEKINSRITMIDDELDTIKEEYTSCFLQYAHNSSINYLFKEIKQVEKDFVEDHPIRLLQEGLNQLNSLKGQWAIVAQHFQSFNKVMTCTVKTKLIDFTNDAREARMDKSLIEFMNDSMQSSYQPAKLLHSFAETYVEVSNRYMINDVKEMSHMLDLGDDGIEQVHKKLVASFKETSNSILTIFDGQQAKQANENRINKSLSDLFKKLEFDKN